MTKIYEITYVDNSVSFNEAKTAQEAVDEDLKPYVKDVKDITEQYKYMGEKL